MIATIIAIVVVIADSLLQICMYMKIDYKELSGTGEEQLFVSYR